MAHKKDGLWHAIRTGLTKVAGSLLVVTTTAGRGDATPDFPIYDYARKVQSGEIVDDSFLPIIFEAPKGADWRDEDLWHAVNPGLSHGYPDLHGLRQLAREAEHRPADREAFQQFHLGIRMDSSAAPFVDSETYDAGAEPIDMEELRGRPAGSASTCHRRATSRSSSLRFRMTMAATPSCRGSSAPSTISGSGRSRAARHMCAGQPKA